MKSHLSEVLRQKNEGNVVHKTSPNVTVLDAVRQMNASKVGSLLVAEGDDVVGMFTERDVLNRVVGEAKDPASTKVAEVMSTQVVAVRPTTTVQEAMGLMTERRCRHLPVVEKGKLMGLISSGDLTRWSSRATEIHVQDLVDYITGKYPR